jgi:hypothetical protein
VLVAVAVLGRLASTLVGATRDSASLTSMGEKRAGKRRQEDIKQDERWMYRSLGGSDYTRAQEKHKNPARP